MSTVAIHLIWTTYMTWPPGDSRGHWSPLFDFYGHLIDTGHKLQLPDNHTKHHATVLAKEPRKVLPPNEITLVANTIGQLTNQIAPGMPGETQRQSDAQEKPRTTSVNTTTNPTANNTPPHTPGMPGAISKKIQPIEGLRIHAAAIEPTHVHLLIAPINMELSKLVGRIKSQTSSALGALPQNQNRSRTWTAGYWKVFLFDEPTTISVQRYIEQHNQRNGLPPAPFHWIEPI